MFSNKRSTISFNRYVLKLPNSTVLCSVYIISMLSLFFYLSFHLISKFSVVRTSPSAPDLCPFYLHYIRFTSATKRNFTFTDYLSVLSAVQYLKPDEILVHGDDIPNGVYWDNLTARNLIRHVHINCPTDFGSREGKPKKPFDIEHFADVAKLDVLLKYGGVAIDFDVFFLHGGRIKEILKKKKAITCYGDEDGNNIGFVAAHKDSKFLWAWRRSYIDIYEAEDWNFNQAFVSKYLSVLYPGDVYVANYICPVVHYEPIDEDYEEDISYYRNAMAVHMYERFQKEKIESSGDLDRVNDTMRSRVFRDIYHNVELPPVDPNFNDEVIPDKL